MMNKKDEKNESTNKEVESILTNQLPEKQNQEDDLKRKHNKTPEITPVKNLQPPQRSSTRELKKSHQNTKKKNKKNMSEEKEKETKSFVDQDLISRKLNFTSKNGDIEKNKVDEIESEKIDDKERKSKKEK
eukprot:Anaeramoba_ignava/a224947_22.p1 GENE.a224947_22~~a224947_22.p1  ORF type:complete len:131 (+),score=60.16 a224947_22:122-514(+)